MRLTVPRIVGILLVLMAGIFVFWELLEKVVWRIHQPADLTAFLLVRGISTAVFMTALTAYLMVRYRRRYEDELRRQSQEAHRTRVFFENIVQDAGEGIISLDNAGVITSWNRAAERIYGYTAAEIIGRNFSLLVPPDLLAAGEQERLLPTVAADDFVRSFEARRIRKDGRTIMVRVTRSLLRDGEGRIIGSSAIVRDITAEKQMQARLIHTEKLAAIGQAAARTAHEVRNALAGIGGTIEVLEGTAAWKQLPDEVAREVKLQLSRIASIINDLLTYARPGLLARLRIDIHEVLDRALAAAASLPEAAHTRAVRRYASGGLLAEGDPAQLQQAFHNLIVNAYQAMERAGTLTIATARADAHIKIRFSDTGRGMPPDTLARALEPFFTTKAKGTGLGLPIVQAIVAAHRGTLQLDSSPPSGTTVMLTLPAVQDARAEASPSRTSAA